MHLYSVLGGTNGLEVSISHVFLRVCWQLLLGWEMGLEVERPKSEPGDSCAFSYARWVSLFYQG